MKKKLVYLGLLFAAIMCFIFYFYGFTRTQAENLSVALYGDSDAGWEITSMENGRETPITANEAINFEGTAVLRRTIPEDWSRFQRVSVDSGRAVCVFVGDSLVYANHRTELTKPDQLPLMKKPEEQPYSMVFAFDPNWVGKTLTVVTRLYEGEPCSIVSFDLADNSVALAQHEAWVNARALPGAMFGLLSFLLFGLLLFQHAAGRKEYSLLLLTLASLLQMFMAMGSLQENPFPWLDQNLATAVYFLLPLLYLGTKLTTGKKRYLVGVSSLWSLYFILYSAVFVFQLPLPYWMDKTELLCVVLLLIMLYYCIREQKENPFVQQFLRLLCAFGIGYVLLYAVTAVLNPHLHQYIQIIFLEAGTLYCRLLLFWLYTSILFALFILAFWEVLQSRIRSIKEMEEIKLRESLISQSLLHAEATNQALAVMRHDEIHHLRTLLQYMGEDVERAREYVASLTQTLEKIPVLRFTKNKLVNSILAAQSASAAEKDVELTASVNIEESLALSPPDLTTVLMNLLDNGVAAAARADREKTKPSVSVVLKQDSNMLYITVSNSKPADFDKEKLYHIVSGRNKDAHGDHGWGIRSVRQILSGYGAELKYQIDHEVTVSTVMQFQCSEKQ